MTEATPVHQLHPETTAEDALTRLIREGAREVLAAALQAEVEEHVDRFRSVVDADGKRRVVRNGFLPEREIQTGAGKLTIKQPRIRVNGNEPGDKELTFKSKLIPPYLRRAKSVKDKDQMIAFFDFPAEHWRHLRTSNPIESTFATVRQRTSRTKGSGSRNATLAMVFKLALCAEHKWRRLNGHLQLGRLIEGAQFKDGINPAAKGDDVAA